ncbi:winged helix-turn-helix transcriptional regulator [Anaerovorax odorimutans]|uniref:Winged helix-turn-helix transcriptional regulator n=2 Tax=Anaerovorax odorimutans TaxID=109327 RepID=A0ABT1RKJ4_9FIRM|nr:ATP-binding protein [Anaerovorax odorimutans]MCQ4635704.1 winged helix-turn-helix transcriptional regulator [Anaerovorax odorimutans]
MDDIANSVSDSCFPQIIPNITFQTVNNKCIVIVEVYPGFSRPYYLKSEGKVQGTYVRVGGTTRPADAMKIKELELEGMNLSWDEQICIGYPVEAETVKKLCDDITKYMLEAAVSEEEKRMVKPVTEQQLLNWKILKKTESQLAATNAFVLMTGEHFPFAKIQCALFKGTDRDIFIDKKEYGGPLYKQIESAYQFVLRHIDLSAEIEGIVRKDAYELPIGAIREMIVNAVCHRNYLDNACVQVAIYDDRLEVTSPGMLYGGLTLEEAMSGRSKIRNRGVAEVLSRMEIIEEWGTGIRRIVKRAAEYSLPEPEFLEIGDSFRVNLYRYTSEKPIKADKKPIKLERERMILQYIEEHESITNKEARELLGLAESTTKRILKDLVKQGVLCEQGERKLRKYYLA